MESGNSTAEVGALIRREVYGPIRRPRPERNVLEASAAGIDEFLQGFGLDADQSLSATGLRVPAFVTAPTGRYVFQLATVRVPQATRIRIRGVKVGVNLGFDQTKSNGHVTQRAVEFPVRTPGWHPPDGGWAFYLMDVPPMNRQPRLFTDSDNFIFRFTETGSALVYETAGFPAGDVNAFGRPDFYTTLNAYTPPFGGRPLGRSIVPVMRDLRYPFDEPSSNWGLELDARSNRTMVLYAVVQQTNPSSRVALTVPDATNTLLGNGFPPEEAFLINYPNAIIWRIFGSILYEELGHG